MDLAKRAPGDKPDQADGDKAEKNYITPSGFRRLQAEFEYLRNHKRREVVVKLSEAAAEGDRSENAEYIYRKRQLRDIDRRIRFLMKRMSLAEVIDPAQQKIRSKVCFGAKVTLQDDDEAGQTVCYQIVGVDESDPKQGRISWRAPIGRALIGKEVDETVTARWHAGERELVVLAIEFPEKADPVAPFLPQMEAQPEDGAHAFSAAPDGQDEGDEGGEDEKGGGQSGEAAEAE